MGGEAAGGSTQACREQPVYVFRINFFLGKEAEFPFQREDWQRGCSWRAAGSLPGKLPYKPRQAEFPALSSAPCPLEDVGVGTQTQLRTGASKSQLCWEVTWLGTPMRETPGKAQKKARMCLKIVRILAPAGRSVMAGGTRHPQQHLCGAA